MCSNEENAYLIDLNQNKYFLKPNEEFTIGRSLCRSLKIEDINVSRMHCKFKEVDGFWGVFDESVNGTWVNHNRIRRLEKHNLSDGDVIKLCDNVEFKFVNRNLSVNVEHDKLNTVKSEINVSNEMSEENQCDNKQKCKKEDLGEGTSSGNFCQREGVLKIPETDESELECSICKELFIKSEINVLNEMSEENQCDDKQKCNKEDLGEGTNFGNFCQREGGLKIPEADESELECSICKELFIKSEINVLNETSEENQCDDKQKCNKEDLGEGTSSGNFFQCEGGLKIPEADESELECSICKELFIKSEINVLNETSEENQCDDKQKCNKEDLGEGTSTGNFCQREGGLKIPETVQSELECSICKELFIKAQTLNCSHTFCEMCINEWKKKNKICPICRENIKTITPTGVLDNLVDTVIQSSSEDVKQSRKRLCEDREESTNQRYKKPKSETSPVARNTRSSSAATVTNPVLVSQSRMLDIEVRVRIHRTSDYLPEYIPGDPRAYYGGYGSCYRCGARGHWANGCPFRLY